MTDFASAAMVRVLAEGMRQLGLKPSKDLEPQSGGDARVTLDLKRLLVAQAMAQGGIGSLALLGRGLRRYRDEPTHQALVWAHSPADLFARWRRLERYIHSRHRVLVESVEEDARGGRALLRHESTQGPSPLAAEDLVVLGVLAALLEELGLRSVRAWVAEVMVLPEADPEALAAAAHLQRTARWTLAWSGAAQPSSAPGPAPRRRPATAEAALTVSAWPEVAARSARLLAQDLARPMVLAELADRLQLSTRTLQRSLADAGLSYTSVLAQTRCRAASWWLIHSETSVAEVGFVCGYADQPHFTRDFRHRVGLPPATFRKEFGHAG